MSRRALVPMERWKNLPAWPPHSCSPLGKLVSLYWSLSNLLTSLWMYRAQNWTQASRQGLSSSKQGRRIATFDLQVVEEGTGRVRGWEVQKNVLIWEVVDWTNPCLAWLRWGWGRGLSQI